ncbi:MAG: tRNA uridine-5-carboxymethylaminomethyl(34) synthesis GTPase MnmE [Hyphomicrobiaceae bacterium]|nr:tRNA uridine-5-carboxymethylaminomethyl(34) synthesis GTPase MnmE [Hyphomicrobiaceae bacterium]
MTGHNQANRSTIFALSSAAGRAGVAVVRVSGPMAGTVLSLMAPARPKPRLAAGRRIIHPTTSEHLDSGVVLWFPAPKSFTGEDVAELQLHGSVAVVRAVLAALAGIPGCRQAEAGEFARRAYDNGKIDLVEAEGLADLIDAETEAQRRQALRQSRGALSSLYESWRASLIEATALVESSIDFSDEGDVAYDAFDSSKAVVTDLAKAIRHHLDDGNKGEILRSGFRVALAGPPNVGKSSLLNALARRDAAIVSEEAGTTRDVIEVRLDLEGLPVIVADTAGIRETTGQVEREGIRRSLATAADADLIIWMTDVLTGEAVLPAELLAIADRVLPIVNKVDLRPGLPDGTQVQALPDDEVAISVLSGAGLSELSQRIAAIARERIGANEEPHLTQERHRQLVQQCLDDLDSFLAGDANHVELRAEDLRRAASALGRITGRIGVEDVLDQVFHRFCIGK